VGKTFSNRPATEPWLACCFAVCFILAFSAVYNISSRQQNSENNSRLTEIASQVISRAEYATDYSLLAAYELINSGELLCDAAGTKAMQRLALARSIIKDIQVYDAKGLLRCQAFPVDGLSLTSDLRHGAVARNPSVTLHNITFYDRQMLGVALDLAEDGRVVIVSDFEALLYDAMPAALRDQSFVSLIIEGLGDFSTIGNAAVLSNDVLILQKAAKRFPLVAHFKIENTALADWHKPSLLKSILIAIGLASLTSLFLVREIQRPLSPTQRFSAAQNANEFQPFFQPIVNAESGVVEGCEALLRWVKTSGEIIPPMRFINELEHSPMLVPITLGLIEQSLFVLSPILQARPAFHIAFNITPDHIIATNFVSDLNLICARHAVQPGSVTVELTERHGLASDEALRCATQLVRRAGYKIALDDVGTGHNGLSQVHDFEADYLKIDKKFVDMLGQSETASSIVMLLVELGQKMGLKLIAEGIESATQAALLRQIGVHKLQGYLYSKPLPASDFISYCQASVLRTTAAQMKDAATVGSIPSLQPTDMKETNFAA
jgi:c-di-GMP phosphodiesterase